MSADKPRTLAETGYREYAYSIRDLVGCQLAITSVELFDSEEYTEGARFTGTLYSGGEQLGVGDHPLSVRAFSEQPLRVAKFMLTGAPGNRADFDEPIIVTIIKDGRTVQMR